MEKQKTHDIELNVSSYPMKIEPFRDKASLTTPIVASHLSTSVSIIDIDKIQSNDGIGCQNDSECWNVRNKQITILYSGSDCTNPSISPNNTILFQSRRTQVGGSARKCSHLKKKRNDHSDVYSNSVKTKLGYPLEKSDQVESRPDKISHPDINVQVISMMLSGFIDSLVQNKNDQCEGTASIVETEQNHERMGAKREERSDGLLDDEHPNEVKKLEVLWKHSLKSYIDPSHKNNILTKKALKHSEKVISLWTIMKSQKSSACLERNITPMRNHELSEDVKADEKLKQIYFDPINENENFVRNQEQLVPNILGKTDVEGNECLIPKIMSEVQNCFSSFSDITNDEMFYLKNQNDQRNSSQGNEVVTIYHAEKTETSSTSFVSNIQNLTNNNPDLNFQNPYCRNYFVYFNNQSKPPFLPTSEMKISRNDSQTRTSFIKHRNFLDKQYCCLKDVGKALMFLTKILRKIYNDKRESIYPSAKCFTSMFRVKDIFKKVASIDYHDRESVRKKETEMVHLKNQIIKKEVIKTNRSLSACRKDDKKRRAGILKDIDVLGINSKSILVRWKLRDICENVERYNIFVHDVLQCSPPHFETSAILQNVDASNPLLIKILAYTDGGYCYSTEVEATLQSTCVLCRSNKQ